MDDYAAIRRQLDDAGQSHLLRFYDELDDARRADLLRCISELDLPRISGLIKRFVSDEQAPAEYDKLQPAPYYSADPQAEAGSWDRAHYFAEGERLLREGRVGVFTVAGGQGTRLGFSGPKGCYPGAAVTGKPLFRCVAEWILAAMRRYDVVIPWCVMTSGANHDATVAFFKDQNWFGLDPQHVTHVQQGALPSFDPSDGRLFLADRDRPAINPDGHGGSIRALAGSGVLGDLQRQGVEHLSYVQIDNPLVKVIDPVFIGLHASAPDSSAEMSSKMIAKTDPDERVGVFCLLEGATRVVEYSDLPDHLAQKRDDAGALLFNAGSPAIHMLSVSFIQRLSEEAGDGLALPLHRANKKVPHIDLESGRLIEPDSPNGVKLEMFVFDALARCERSIILETKRDEEFAPIKNATGADSPATSGALQVERAARWLERAGVRIARSETGDPACELEISPLAAMRWEDLRDIKLPDAVGQGATLVIEPG